MGLDKQYLSDYPTLTAIEVGAFDGLRSLKQLHVVWCGLAILEVGLFDGLVLLEELDLHDNPSYKCCSCERLPDFAL